jgi:hypothetical protein
MVEEDFVTRCLYQDLRNQEINEDLEEDPDDKSSASLWQV